MEKNQKSMQQTRKRNSEVANKRKNLKRNGAKALFGDKCQDCGYDKHWEVLEFHHKIPRAISGRPKINAVFKWTWEKVREEVVEHCVLLCPTCHKLRHLKEDGERRFGYEIDI